MRFRVRPTSEPDVEPPLFAVITEDAKNDAHVELWDVPASEYDASGIEPEAQPVVALTPAAARLHGFDEAQQRLHPRVSLPGDSVRAFTPDTSLAVSTVLLPAAILAHPRPASGGVGSILIDGRAGSVPQGKALLDAVFSEGDGEHDAQLDAAATPAARHGLVRSRVSFQFRGEGEAVPLLIPSEQADGNSDLVSSAY